MPNTVPRLAPGARAFSPARLPVPNPPLDALLSDPPWPPPPYLLRVHVSYVLRPQQAYRGREGLVFLTEIEPIRGVIVAVDADHSDEAEEQLLGSDDEAGTMNLEGDY